MAKTMTVSNTIAKRLDKIKLDYWNEEQDELSYSEIIKIILKKADMWKMDEEPTISVKKKSTIRLKNK